MAEDTIKDQLEGMKKMVALATRRTEMAAHRSYLNAERTLSVWIRTALSAMIFGIAIDRLGLMLYQIPQKTLSGATRPDLPSRFIGMALVVFSIGMALTAMLRFVHFTKAYKREFSFPAFHTGRLPVAYAILIVLFGLALLGLMIWIR